MSIDLRSLTARRIVDFSGGLNEFASSFTMADNELQEATNVELIRTGGAIRTRKGSPRYQRQSFSSITTPVTSMFRYSRFNGDKKVLAFEGSNLYHDDDNGNFSLVRAVTTDDGRVRFAQWREMVFFGTKSFGLWAYDPYLATSTIQLNTPGKGAISGQGTVPTGGTLFSFTPITVAAGALTPTYTYHYRFTIDVYHGNTFIGESGVAWLGAAGFGRQYRTISPTLGATDNAFEIRCGANLGAEIGNLNVGAINIYRVVVGNPAASPGLFNAAIETNMIFVCSLPRNVWADTVTLQFNDYGLSAGRSIAQFYGRTEQPPCGRFNAIHKSRLWQANVRFTTYDDKLDAQVQTDTPHRVYFSETNEPAVFLPTSWVEVDPTDGDGVTGIVSYKNKVLIVFQANSIWAISGGDDEIGPGIPDISIENISTDLGCVAPESIQVCEGRLVWLSHRGVYYYDGTIPKPMQTEYIDQTLLNRPLLKYSQPVSLFLVKEREYWLAHSSPESDPLYNTLISKFNFEKGAWVRGNIGVGIASMVEKKDMNRPPLVLAGIEAASGVMAADTAVRYLQVGDYDDGGSLISWAWKTRFYDFNAPHMDKKFIAILVQLVSESDVTMGVFCDNHLANELFTISLTENDQALGADELIWANTAGTSGGDWSDGTTGPVWADGNRVRNALIYLNTKCWGKRIALRFSGSNDTEIQAITFFYDPKEGVRQ